jgi:hypothetical protein
MSLSLAKIQILPNMTLVGLQGAASWENGEGTHISHTFCME